MINREGQMKTLFALVLAVSSVACGLEVKNPESQNERTNREQKEFYAKQNELRAQNQAARQASSEEKAKEKNPRLEAEDVKRKADYEARLERQKITEETKHVAAETQYIAQQAEAKSQDRVRYEAKKAAQDKKDAAEEAAIEVEIAQCKSNLKCTWERVSKPLCEALDSKRMYQQEMSKERANPSGIVNIKYLHDLGMEIQLCDANIAMFRKDYREHMGRTFNEATCQK